MLQRVEAVYEHGVLRPLEPVSLAESQRVKLTISEAGRTHGDSEFLERVRAEVASMHDVPSLEEVQRIVSKIPGSLTSDFIAEREE